MAACGAGNPDHPDAAYRCEYPAGHDRLWRYGAWQDHGAPSANVWWVVAPYSEDDVAAVHYVIQRITKNPQLEALLLNELAAIGVSVEALTHGAHAPQINRPDRPEYRAAGYTVIEPRGM
jgi:hypothetical protein